MTITSTMPSMPAHQRTLSSVSSSAEDLFSSITGFDDFANEDDLSLEDIDESGDGSGKNGAKKGRKLASTAEKKATHNAVERARRESLNVRFLVLADMLPGMNHVKRASKAGIVNKSIALIQELQATEKRLGSENEALKAELEALRQQIGQAQAAAAAAATAGMMAPMHFAGLPGMPAMPAMMQQQHQQQQNIAHAQQQQQQQQQAHQAMAMSAQSAFEELNGHTRRASAPMPSMPAFPGYPGIFATSEAIHENSTVKSEQGCSPASEASKSNHRPAPSNDLFSASGLFDFSTMGGMPVTDLTGQMLSASPASYANSLGNSPPGTVASLVSDKASSSSNSNGLAASNNSTNNNPSPASSTSISTPGNTYSPGPLAFDSSSASAAAVGAPKSATSSPTNPVLAAFDNNSDAAFLAAQFAPRDLAKAQSELQAFMAYQQRMAAMGAAGMSFPHNMMGSNATSGGNTTPSPTTPGFPHHVQPMPSPNHFAGMPNTMAGYGFPGQFGGAAGTPGHPGMGNMPAWQMMMAQQQALSTYGGLGNHF